VLQVKGTVTYQVMEEKHAAEDPPAEETPETPAGNNGSAIEDWWDEFRRERAGWEDIDFAEQRRRFPTLPPLSAFKKEWSAKIVGTKNPHDFTSYTFWQFMIYSACKSSVLRKLYLPKEGEDDQIAQDEDDFIELLKSAVAHFDQLTPTWCYDRFGQSVTKLPDGRRVIIAGEYEDFYDEDFFIYNDVVVLAANGDIEHIFGYPPNVFPPTDFHTAVYVPPHNAIYIIGTVGHQATRNRDVTPVYKLNLTNWQISKVETHGTMPNWISRAEGTFDATAGVIVLTGGKILSPEGRFEGNGDTFILHLKSFSWAKLAKK